MYITTPDLSKQTGGVLHNLTICENNINGGRPDKGCDGVTERTKTKLSGEELKMMDLLSNARADWDNWKKFLAQAVEFAEELGVSRDRISALACQAGDVLAETVLPSNPEQKVLKELWNVSDPQEKQMLANLMTKLCSGHRM